MCSSFEGSDVEIVCSWGNHLDLWKRTVTKCCRKVSVAEIEIRSPSSVRSVNGSCQHKIYVLLNKERSRWTGIIYWKVLEEALRGRFTFWRNIKDIVLENLGNRGDFCKNILCNAKFWWTLPTVQCVLSESELIWPLIRMIWLIGWWKFHKDTQESTTILPMNLNEDHLRVSSEPRKHRTEHKNYSRRLVYNWIRFIAQNIVQTRYYHVLYESHQGIRLDDALPINIYLVKITITTLG